MALRGNLKDFSLPDVFQLVQLSGKTGVLRIAGPEAEGSIWFRDGDVFFAQSNWRREQLGERLVGAQRITPAALARALEIRGAEGEGGRRLGEVLVNEGYITQQVLETFVQEQIQDTIFDLMRWDEGDFDFHVLPEVVNEDIGLSVSVENIVMEGSRRLEEWQRIKKKVPSTEMVFKMATAPGEGTFEISLKPVEWALLLLIDGTRSVRELALETHSTDFEVARVVYGLFSAGLLEVPADDEVERLRAERLRRDDKRAVLQAERSAREAEQQAQALDLEAKLVADAEARQAADDASAETTAEPGTLEEPIAETPLPAAEATADEEQAAAEVAPHHEPEEPEFLAISGESASSDDMAIFEQMMASVLTPQTDDEPAGGVEPVGHPESADLAIVDESAQEPALAPEAGEYEIAGDIEPGLIIAPEVTEYDTPEETPFVSSDAPMPESEETGYLLGELVPGLDFVPDADLTAVDEAPVVSDEPDFFIPAAPVSDDEPSAWEVTPVEDFGIGAISGVDIESIPEPPIAEFMPVAEPFAGTGDFETDLRSLGLGEYPEELLIPEPPTAPQLPMSEIDAGRVEVPEIEQAAPLDDIAPSDEIATIEESPGYGDAAVPTELVEFPEAGAVDRPAAVGDDLESLLASLGDEPTPAGEGTSEGVISSGIDYGTEEDASEGYISTDVFLAEFDDDIGLSGGLGDELTALTGGAGGRSRPMATVNKLPEDGESHMLHRDQMVDRSLLEKIIEGIENL